MTSFPSQKNNLIFAIIMIGIVFLLLGIMWYAENHLTQQMTQFCHNLSMEYDYKDSTSFYCFSANGSIIIKEVRYK